MYEKRYVIYFVKKINIEILSLFDIILSLFEEVNSTRYIL